MGSAVYRILINSINYKIRLFLINKNKITNKLLYVNKNLNIKLLNSSNNLIDNTINNNEVMEIKKEEIILIKIPEALINSPTLISIKKQAYRFNKKEII